MAQIDDLNPNPPQEPEWISVLGVLAMPVGIIAVAMVCQFFL
jgi:hypothetical protein